MRGQDLRWGWWNSFTAWVVLIVQVFSGWAQYPFFDSARSGNWYDIGFLLGAWSPLLGACGRGWRQAACTERKVPEETERSTPS
jgi:hypothetical protein